MNLRPFGAGIAGGLLAGAAVGAIEALASWFGAHGTGDLPAIGWALVVYGMVGALGGLAAGVVAAIFRTSGFGLALAGVGAGLGFGFGPLSITPGVTYVSYKVDDGISATDMTASMVKAEIGVRITRHRDLLVVEVIDDGAGGADPAKGTGLRGLADRVAAVDGRLTVTSPPGGPTTTFTATSSTGTTGPVGGHVLGAGVASGGLRGEDRLRGA